MENRSIAQQDLIANEQPPTEQMGKEGALTEVELHAVVQELGGEQTFGRTLTSEKDLREAIREGFPPAVVQELMHALVEFFQLLDRWDREVVR
jgi:hypothetical protein